MSGSSRFEGLKGDKGVSVVIFALAIPILALAVFGMAEFALRSNSHDVNDAAASLGVQVADLHYGSANQMDAVLQAVKDELGDRQPVQLVVYPAQDASGTPVWGSDPFTCGDAASDVCSAWEWDEAAGDLVSSYQGFTTSEQDVCAEGFVSVALATTHESATPINVFGGQIEDVKTEDREACDGNGKRLFFQARGDSAATWTLPSDAYTPFPATWVDSSLDERTQVTSSQFIAPVPAQYTVDAVVKLETTGVGDLELVLTVNGSVVESNGASVTSNGSTLLEASFTDMTLDQSDVVSALIRIEGDGLSASLASPDSSSRLVVEGVLTSP